MRRKYFTEANNSLHETVGALDLAEAIGALDAEQARALLGLGIRLKRMLRGLLTG
jgi:hypothetical protein